MSDETGDDLIKRTCQLRLNGWEQLFECRDLLGKCHGGCVGSGIILLDPFLLGITHCRGITEYFHQS
jgi:hypothetical protein